MKLYKFTCSYYGIGHLTAWVCASDEEKALNILLSRRIHDGLPYTSPDDWVLDQVEEIKPGLMFEATE